MRTETSLGAVFALVVPHVDWFASCVKGRDTLGSPTMLAGGRLTRLQGVTVCVALLLALGAIGATRASTACDASGTILIADSQGSPIAIDPATGAVGAVPDHVSGTGRAWFARLLGKPAGPPRWEVVRTSEDAGTRIVVRDTLDGRIVLDERFGRRMELATSAVSPTGRFTLYIQGNNVATEVTILDARSGSTRFSRIVHDADLAPFAIGVAFSPDGRCAALSMERIGGPGPETWMLELDTGRVWAFPVTGVFVVDWLPAQVD